MLWKGSRGQAVSKLQLRLQDLGYYLGAIDGDFGQRTLEAVFNFQKDHGLVVDGFVGPRTLAALSLQQVPEHQKESKRSMVFISYSHKDAKWLEQLRVHLAPLERDGLVSRWDDALIAPGDKWRKEIAKAIAKAKVAVLLISPNFMASQFIQTNELPTLLAAAERDGTVIAPVIISPCLMRGLSEYQSINTPTKPMVDLSRGDRDRVWVSTIEWITAALNS